MHPDEVPSIKTISVGGEPLTQDCIDTWASRVKLFNSYGPTEACVFCCIASIGPSSLRTNIGYPSGCRLWIVDPEDHNTLVPIGEVGELVVEGDILARGYLHDEDKTSKAFPKSAARAGSSPEEIRKYQRFYKTGDLARYEADGSICCLGRKDSQVKIRGQRVELGEIESHIKALSHPDVRTALVDWIPSGDTGKLVAYLVLPTLEKDDAQTWSIIRGLTSKLSETLPPHMVPTDFVPVRGIPSNSSGKADRKRLQQIFEESSRGISTAPVRGTTEPNIASSSRAHRVLTTVVAHVLSLTTMATDTSRSFLQLGGNSLLAIKVVARLRKRGFRLVTKSLLQHHPLRDVRLSPEPTHSNREDDSRNRATEENRHDPELKAWVASECDVAVKDVELIGPCTPFQQTLVPSLLTTPCSYISQNSFDLPSDLDLGKFKACWEEAYSAFPMLRSRIVQTPSQGPLRVVVKHKLVWREQDLFDASEREDMMQQFKIGGALCFFALQRGQNGHVQLILTLHHLLFDAWSLDLMLDHVAQKYYGAIPRIPETPHYDEFAKFSLRASKSSASEAFWRSTLEGSCAASFPRLPSAGHQPCLDGAITLEVESDMLNGMVTAKSVLIRASLALTIGNYTGQHDVAIGTVMSGRDADMVDIDEVVGPTLVTIPYRTTWDQQQSVSSFLDQVKHTQELAIPHQHFGLQHIRKLSPGAANACDFQTLLVIQAPHSRTLKEPLWSSRVETEKRGSQALELECTMLENQLVIEARFDSGVMSEAQTRRFLSLWIHELRQLSERDADTPLAAVNILSQQDMETLSLWSDPVPAAGRELVHEKLAQWAISQPDNVALDSWDGKLSYRQLDDLSSNLAALLLAFGPGPVVPLHLPKGNTLIVAIWAILKSGRAFLALDTDLPSERIASILCQLDNPLVLSEDAKFVRQVASVEAWNTDMSSIRLLPRVPSGWTVPVKQAHSQAYMIMTSGSTGQPKGVMIHHEAISTTMEHSTPFWGYSRDSRALLFSSVAFDASVFDILASVFHGACLCIPEQGAGLDELVEFMNTKKVNHSFFTPSFLKVIKPADVPGLRFVVSGGEALTVEAGKNWAGSVRLVNGFGPSECAITCNSALVDPVKPDIACIGRALGCVSWIVDPEDHNRLLPIGATGELLIEGPIVGSGYFQDAEKTAAAFISPPTWSERFGRVFGRMFKTGDLVRYDDSGSLIYLGRKDNQVKLRGQRLELGEVEHHLEVISTRPSLCFVPKKGPLAKSLVAVLGTSDKRLVPTSEYMTVALDPEEIHQDVRLLREQLLQVLPRYMVPETMAVLHDMPISLSGKLDRKTIAAWLDQLSDADTRFFSTGSDDSGNDFAVTTDNPVEAVIQEVWATVLALPTHKVALNRSFQFLGGDSITAMQAVARTRNKGFKTEIKHILRGDTIQTLAPRAISQVTARNEVATPAASEQPFPLSPMQRTYFSLAPESELHHFNQSIQVLVQEPITVDALQAALKAVVQRHASLRTKYQQSSEGHWTQRVTNKIRGIYQVTSSNAIDPHDIIQRLREDQFRVHPVNGPLIHAHLLREADGAQRLIIVAVHLAVDIVSWKLILEDLETALKGGVLPGPDADIFQSWCEKKRLSAAPKSSLPPPDYDYWGVDPMSLDYSDVQREKVIIEAPITALCLGRANDCLRTKPTDIFIAAINTSFQQTFPDRQPPPLCLEGHGRQSRHHTVDISGTVGWFTQVTPVYAAATAAQTDPVDYVRMVKDAGYKAEENGLDFFAIHGLSGNVQIPEIMINYEGVVLGGPDADSHGLFMPDPESSGDVYDVSSNMRRFAVFDVAIAVRDSQLEFEFLFNRRNKYSDRVKTWAAKCGEVLGRLVRELSITSPQPTLSDYPDLSLTYQELSALGQKLQDIGIGLAGAQGTQAVAIFEATPTQDQMLEAQRVNQRCWQVSQVLKITNKNGKHIDLARLQTAWGQVVGNNDVLRTVLVRYPSERSTHLNVVMDKEALPVSFTAVKASHPAAAPPTKWLPGEPQHRLTFWQRSEGEVLCRLEVNHALVDHYTVGRLLDDLSQRYNGKQATSIPIAFQEYASFVAQQAAEEGIEHWRKHLENASPSLIAVELESTKVSTQPTEEVLRRAPVELSPAAGAHIDTLSRACGVTSATVFHLAWAKVLGTRLRRDDVVLGAVVSGRDSAFEGIEHVIGPVMGVAACPVSGVGRTATRVLLTQVQEALFSGSTHHNQLPAYLSERRCGPGGLFDTVVNFRRHAHAHEGGTGLIFEEQAGSEDPYQVRSVCSQLNNM